MKKTVLIIMLSCISLIVLAQHNENEKVITDTIPRIDGKYEYQEIVNLDSTFKKDDLYRNAKLYMVDNFKSAKDVIQYDDKEQGKIIGKGTFELRDYHMLLDTKDFFTWHVSYSTEITCKNGKYRYKLYDITIQEYIENTSHTNSSLFDIDDALVKTKKGFFKKVTTRLINSMLHHFKNTQVIIKEYMSKKQDKSKDDF
jgi:hypothetical protein